METKTDLSFGVIPLMKKAEGWQVLLIHQISYRGVDDTFWTFPKGHKEQGETDAEAALRELQEETGITKVSLDTTRTFETSYEFVHAGTKIKKTVQFWIGYCTEETVVISQPREIKELRWVSLEAAYNLLSHTNTKTVLRAVESYLST